MSKRFIGIDLDAGVVRIAIITVIAGKVDIELDRCNYATSVEAETAILKMLGGKIALGDRLVTALPCRAGLFRSLRFPFRDKNKLKAALPLAMGLQLPISLKEHQVAFLTPRSVAEGYDVDAVAVEKSTIAEVLDHFPDAEQHPRRIDFFPFALLPELNDGIVIYCRQAEVVVAHVEGGVVCDYRLLPGQAELSENDLVDTIANQLGQFENSCDHEELSVSIIGMDVPSTLQTYFEDTGRTISTPGTQLFGREIPAEMVPVALLATVERHNSGKTDTFNFRQDDFAARGQLEVFRAKLVAVALLTLLVVVGVVLTMHFGYLQKIRQEQVLKQQLVDVFYQLMPAGAVVVDVPLQLQSQVLKLQQQVQLFGLGDHGVTTILHQLSTDIDAGIRIDLDEFNYNTDSVRLSGKSDSFESIDRIAATLRENRLFERVEIVDAKLATDNRRVNFELQLIFSGEKM